ncbi:MAG: methyltransferase domain-containing protein, partial [Planctomycetota bacterium]|nr:methyltransferase domain-containing protein [Planctomycetota bacterium]
MGDVDLFAATKRLCKSPGLRFLEVGCAPGGSMVYFARTFGCAVSGFDYAPVGVELTKRNLEMSGVPGQVWHADLLSPDMPVPKHSFDVVFSMGVIEHFQEPRKALEAIHTLVAPGGMVITSVPNITYLQGWLMRWMNPKRWEWHAAIGPEWLRDVQEDLGAKIVHCRYSGAYSLSELEVGLRERCPWAKGVLSSPIIFKAMGAASRRLFRLLGG